jgi:single-strand DNA-binding protein
MSLNRITLVGRITRNPELKNIGDKKLVEFSIAVNKRVKPKEGSDADFFYVKAWGQTAGYVSEYLDKGRLVAIDGRLETNQYEKDGKQVTSYYITADNVNSLDRPKDNSGMSKSNKSKSSDDEYSPWDDE